jgi:hypothetical protein
MRSSGITVKKHSLQRPGIRILHHRRGTEFAEVGMYF